MPSQLNYKMYCYLIYFIQKSLVINLFIMSLNRISQESTQEIDDGMASLQQLTEQFNQLSGPTSKQYGVLRADDVQQRPYAKQDQSTIQDTHMNQKVRAPDISQHNSAEQRVQHLVDEQSKQKLSYIQFRLQLDQQLLEDDIQGGQDTPIKYLSGHGFELNMKECNKISTQPIGSSISQITEFMAPQNQNQEQQQKKSANEIAYPTDFAAIPRKFLRYNQYFQAKLTENYGKFNQRQLSRINYNQQRQIMDKMRGKGKYTKLTSFVFTKRQWSLFLKFTHQLKILTPEDIILILKKQDLEKAVKQKKWSFTKQKLYLDQIPNFIGQYYFFLENKGKWGYRGFTQNHINIEMKFFADAFLVRLQQYSKVPINKQFMRPYNKKDINPIVKFLISFLLENKKTTKQEVWQLILCYVNQMRAEKLFQKKGFIDSIRAVYFCFLVSHDCILLDTTLALSRKIIFNFILKKKNSKEVHQQKISIGSLKITNILSKDIIWIDNFVENLSYSHSKENTANIQLFLQNFQNGISFEQFEQLLKEINIQKSKERKQKRNKKKIQAIEKYLTFDTQSTQKVFSQQSFQLNEQTSKKQQKERKKRKKQILSTQRIIEEENEGQFQDLYNVVNQNDDESKLSKRIKVSRYQTIQK